MTVSRRNRSKKKEQNIHLKESKAGGSRFSPLASPADVDQSEQKETALPKDPVSKPATADPEPHVEMAKALAKVLTDSSLYKEAVASASKAKPTEDRQPLADVTNTANKSSRGVATAIALFSEERNVTHHHSSEVLDFRELKGRD
ncbi:hypothetical protein LINPERHAP1_LOCUS30622 [Linum perenne]